MDVMEPISPRRSFKDIFRVFVWRIFCMSVVFTEILVIFVLFAVFLWGMK